MPSKSKQQQKFMGMVHALKKGDIEPSSVSKSVKDAAKSMSKKDTKDFASTKHKNLPLKVKQEILNKLKEYANKMGRDHLGGDDYTSKKKGGLRDFDGYDNVDYNKDMPMDEASRGTIHKAAKKGSYPVSLVVVKDGKVINQVLNIKTPAEVPAAFNVVKNYHKHKGATVHIEDRTGKRLFSESVNEDKFYNTRVQYTDPKSKKKFVGDVVRKDGDEYKVNLGKDGRFEKYILAKSKDLKIVSKSKKRTYESVNEGMFSMIDQIRQDSKDVRDFVKNVFKDKEFRKMKDDKEFIKYLKSIYEGTNESKGVPQNYMQGRTSDYHTALRGKNRDYSGGTNFKKKDHGQPDIENEDEDQETNQLSNKQTHVKSDKLKVSEEMDNLSSSERLELYKLYSKAMKAMPGSPNQKKLKVLINKLRKKASLKPLPEYGQRLDLSFIEDEEAKLKGTPKSKDTIDRNMD